MSMMATGLLLNDVHNRQMTAVYVMSIMAFITECKCDIHDTLNTNFRDDLDNLQCFCGVCDFREVCDCDVRLMALVSAMSVMSMMTLTIVIFMFPFIYMAVLTIVSIMSAMTLATGMSLTVLWSRCRNFWREPEP
jgi:hypothetical protein